MDERTAIREQDILSAWHDFRMGEQLKHVFPQANLDQQNMVCLKDTFKSSIWKLQLQSPTTSSPVILKIFKPLKRKRIESIVEKKIYMKARKVIGEFMPEIYHIQEGVNGDQTWVWMEYVRSLNEQIRFHPRYFQFVIPSLAKLHAHTFNERFEEHRDIFKRWLPRYDSKEANKEREKLNKKTSLYLEKAMDHPELYPLLKPHYPVLKKTLKKGPIYFPQILESGQSLVHSDLQTTNIACNNLNSGPSWNIKLIDWEGAKFASPWFDLVNFVGVFLAYRRDWKDQERSIIRDSMRKYAEEMHKHGVTFKLDPVRLYRMTYLQRMLEKGLYLQLSWAISGRKKPLLLPVYLEKFQHWGKRYGLF